MKAELWLLIFIACVYIGTFIVAIPYISKDGLIGDIMKSPSITDKLPIIIMLAVIGLMSPIPELIIHIKKMIKYKNIINDKKILKHINEEYIYEKQ